MGVNVIKSLPFILCIITFYLSATKLLSNWKLLKMSYSLIPFDNNNCIDENIVIT